MFSDDDFDVESVLTLFIRKKIRIMNIIEDVDKIQENKKSKNETKHCDAISLEKSSIEVDLDITLDDTDASLSHDDH